MHEEVRYLPEEIGKGHFDIKLKNWRISCYVLVGRRNQKVFPWNALDVIPEFGMSPRCPNLFTGTLSMISWTFCHYFSFPTSPLISR